MPKRVTLPVTIGMSTSPDGAVSNSLVKNLMPYVPDAPGASTTGALVPVFGIENWDDDIGRGWAFEAGGVLYQLRNSGGDAFIYSIDPSAGTETQVATLGSDTISIGAGDSIAYASYEGKDIVVLCERGGDSFEFDIGGATITKITDAVFTGYQADPGGVLSVVSGDGYFIFCTKRNVFISKNISEWSATALEFNALDFADAEYKPDLNVTLKWYNGQLRVFGEHTIETWANIGGADFPFQRIPGATIEKGLGVANESSIQEVDNSLIWGGNGQNETTSIWQLTSGSVRRISNAYIEQAINNEGLEDGEADVSDSMSFRFNGRSYYGVRVPGLSDWSVIDLTASSIQGYPVWFQWDISNDSRNFVSYRGNVYLSGRYRLNNTVYTETDNALWPSGSETETTPERQFTSGYLFDQMHDVYVPRVELQMKVGTGLASGSEANTNPTVQMEVSDDFGITWLDFGSRPIGTSGSGRAKVVWSRGCGASPSHRLFRFTTNTATETVFLNVVLDVEGAVH